MQENQLSQVAEFVKSEPLQTNDNFEETSNANVDLKESEDKSYDPSALILGKFKTTEDLT